MCRALPPGPVACAAYPTAGSLGDFQVTGCMSFCFPGDVGWASALPFFFCASSAPAGLQGFAGFCTLCQGAPVGVVSALWTTVSSPYWLSLTLGWVSFWTAVSTVSVSCEVCGLVCPSWFVLLFMSVCPSPALGLGWFGHRSVTPPAAHGFWALLESRLRRSDALASGRTLSFFSRRGFLPWAFVRTWVGRLRSCLGSYLLLGVLSFPCPGFRWAVPAVWLSRRLVFSWKSFLGFFPLAPSVC